MAKKKKKSVVDQLTGNPERTRVYDQLWANKRYLAIDKLKSRVGRDWNIADAFKNQPGGSHAKAAKLDKRFKRVIQAGIKMEAKAFKKAGLLF